MAAQLLPMEGGVARVWGAALVAPLPSPLHDVSLHLPSVPSLLHLALTPIPNGLMCCNTQTYQPYQGSAKI